MHTASAVKTIETCIQLSGAQGQCVSSPWELAVCAAWSFCVPAVLNGSVSQLLVSAAPCPSPEQRELRLHPELVADMILSIRTG